MRCECHVHAMCVLFSPVPECTQLFLRHIRMDYLPQEIHKQIHHRPGAPDPPPGGTQGSENIILFFFSFFSFSLVKASNLGQSTGIPWGPLLVHILCLSRRSVHHTDTHSGGGMRCGVRPCVCEAHATARSHEASLLLVKAGHKKRHAEADG